MTPGKIKIELNNVLRWVEKYLKTDIAYLVKGGAWLTIGQFFSGITAFLLSIAFANLLTKEDYGTYKYILAIAGILSIPTLRGINVSIIQSIAQGKEGVATEGIKTKIKWGLLSGVLAFAASCYYFFQDNHVLGTLLLICVAFLPFKEPFGAYVAILNGKKDFRRITLYGTFFNIIYALTAILILFLTRSIYYALLFYLAFWTISNLIALIITLHKLNLNNISDPKSLSYGKHLSLAGVISIIAGYFDKLIIFHFLGAASVAAYSIAMAPISQINGFTGNLNALAMPKFMRHTDESLKAIVKTKSAKIIIATLPIAVLYVYLADPFFNIFFPKYTDAVIYSQILAASIPFTALSRFNLTAIQSRFNKKIFYIYTSGVAMLQIFLISIFGYFYGLFGIIVSYLIINITQTLITIFIIKKI